MREKERERNQFRKESIAANRERKTETTNGNNGKIVCNKMYFTVPRTGDCATLRGQGSGQAFGKWAQSYVL